MRAFTADNQLSQIRDGIYRSLGEHDDKTHTDEPTSDMTNSRLLARFLSRFRWYCPPNNKTNLDQAWKHYEYNTLARIYKDEKGFVRAPRGTRHERPTRLYPLLATPLKELGDFGFSVRMYFSTLLVLASALFIAGIFNLPLAMYFWNHYNQDREKFDESLPFMVQASALCPDQVWVDELQLWRNECNFDDWLVPGLCSYGASLLLILQLGVAFFWLQRKAEIVFDEQVQTSSDYSIKISNPPADATDPEEWKGFLDKFAGDKEGVISCTIALDNAELLKKLVERRKILQQISRKLKYTSMDNRKEVLAEIRQEPVTMLERLFCISSLLSRLWKKLEKVEAELQPLMEKKYKAIAVFATFEHERGQRNTLHCLSIPKLHHWMNRTQSSKFTNGAIRVEENAESAKAVGCGTLVEELLEEEKKELHMIELVTSQESLSQNAAVDRFLRFRKLTLLKVKEACEPSDVRWLDLEVPFWTRSLQFSISTVAMICFVCWSGMFINNIETKRPGSSFTPIFITVTNLLVPKICGFINGVESHSTEASSQISLYAKVALFRWFNSAIALTLVIRFKNSIAISTSHGSTLSESVYNLIFAELFTSPLLKLLDIVNFLRKHVFAPRAQTQEEMNACFVGGQFQLAERYTDATKILFVAFFYSTILPESLFLGALALLTHFCVGKFCLLRLWRPAADVGPSLSRLSRNVFFSSSLVVHVVASSYWWSGFPFDNVCGDDENGYSVCDQDFLRRGVFPPLPRFQPMGSEWMTSSQELLTSLYSYTAVVLLCLSVLVMLKFLVVPIFVAIFQTTYEPDGKDQNQRFSSAKHRQEIEGYIPQIRVPSFCHPLLACDLQRVDPDLIGWKEENMDQFCFSKDVAELSSACGINGPVLSPMGFWLPASKAEK